MSDSCSSCGCGSGCGTTSNKWEGRSLVIAGVILTCTLVADWGGVIPPAAVMWLAIATIITGGWFLFPKSLRSLRAFKADINLLVVLATIGASIIGEWTEAATVVVLFGVAEWLEGWADRRAKRAVKSLLDLAPAKALVLRDGQFVELPVEQVKIGERIAVKSGMKVPLDGKIILGTSAINQAPITGESVPVDKAPGDVVFAATVNGEGSLEIEVTKLASDTTLARIIRLVTEAQEQKAPTQRLVEKFARYYTPLVAVAAIAIFLIPPLLGGGDWSVWLYRACVLLIIACPCALVISTPVGIVAGLTALAKRGVLVKGGTHLESLARIRTLAVDKTGTITEGRPTVAGITVVNTSNEKEILRVAAAIDIHSAHPLAKAIVDHAKSSGTFVPRSENYKARSGKGAEGDLDGIRYFVGNRRLAEEFGTDIGDYETPLKVIEGRGQSCVIVGSKEGGKILGLIAIGDLVRSDAKTAIKLLHHAGVSKIVMLSGDNQAAADFIGRQVGIDQVRGNLLPEDKVDAVKSLLGSHGAVGMVGDGVNDAPAMAAATIGIAMGGTGTDAAIETSDVTLMKDDLGAIAGAILLGRRTLKIIRFNIAFALSLKAVFLILTLTGHASMWLAIFADTGATLIVTANALRLLRSSES